MIKYLIILTLLHQNSPLINKIITETNLKSDELLIIIYQTNGSCTKCFYQPNYLIEDVMKRVNYRDKVKIMSFVYCDREKELNIFRKKYNWKHYLLRDDGNVFKVLKIDKKSILTVMNPKGELIFNVTDKDNEGASEKLLGVLNQELEKLKK